MMMMILLCVFCYSAVLRWQARPADCWAVLSTRQEDFFLYSQRSLEWHHVGTICSGCKYSTM